MHTPYLFIALAIIALAVLCTYLMPLILSALRSKNRSSGESKGLYKIYTATTPAKIRKIVSAIGHNHAPIDLAEALVMNQETSPETLDRYAIPVINPSLGMSFNRSNRTFQTVGYYDSESLLPDSIRDIRDNIITSALFHANLTETLSVYILSQPDSLEKGYWTSPNARNLLDSWAVKNLGAPLSSLPDDYAREVLKTYLTS